MLLTLFACKQAALWHPCPHAYMAIPLQVRRTKPTAGKRKATEPAELDSAHPPSTDGCAGNALALAPSDAVPDAVDTDTGPMTKAKKRKGEP